MKLLLDTCALLYSTLTPDKLSGRVKQALQDSDPEVFGSIISAGEIACNYGKKIHLDRHWKTWFRERCAVQQWNLLNVDLDIIEEAYSLPDPFHRDPADRILVATSRIKRIPLVTNDTLITNYPHVNLFW